MEPTPQKKWYQKTGYVLGLSILAIIAIVAIGSSQQTTPSPNSTPIEAFVASQAQSAAVIQSGNPVEGVPEIASTTQDNGLSNNNYYTNTDGNSVHSPAYSDSNTAPEGATAQCNDGTYSFSQHHSGTCSHHGGVSEWLN